MSEEFSLVSLSPYHIFLTRRHTTNNRNLVVEALYYEPKDHRFKAFPCNLLQGVFNQLTNQVCLVVILASKFQIINKRLNTSKLCFFFLFPKHPY